MQESDRIAAVQTPIIPVVGALIREHPGTISLGQGVVHYPPPADAIKRMEGALDDPQLHTYKAVSGVDKLLALIETKLSAENGLACGAHSRPIVTAGGNMAFMNAVLAITDPGDEVIIQSPYYFNHEMAIRISGCKPVEVATDCQYQLQPDAIEAALTPRTRAVVTVSPNNPTGAVYDEASLRRVNAICRKAGVYHISDEAYEYFTFNGAQHFSPGSIEEAAAHTISLYSLSKAYGFASWRIGYMVVPDHLVTAVKKIQDTILICPPVVNQYAAVGAMEVGAAYCRRYLPGLAQVRQGILDELGKLGDRITVPVTNGAFYMLIRVNSSLDPMELAEQLIRDHGVALIPGTAFGVQGECCLRLSYGSLEKDTVAVGLERFTRGIGQIVGD
jgi:aspartate/methionine/tyrosine aminotransferase